jgi:hypothetical protein
MISTDTTIREVFVEATSGIVSNQIAHELFDLFNQIALTRYETSESYGFLVLSQLDAYSTMPFVRLESPFDVCNVRGVRKMLQISDQHLYVLCDGRVVYGFATSVADCPDALVVQFRHHGVWELRRDGRMIVRMNVQDEPCNPLRLQKNQFIAGAQKVFGSLSQAELQYLWSLITAANRQSRGTNVLISACAEIEAKRLESQCTKVEPVRLTPSLMERLTSIDGTVIMDQYGVCHAIGAILDGGVATRGDRTRGGRYNSALMYVDSTPFASLIVVISQDDMVDLVYKG